MFKDDWDEFIKDRKTQVIDALDLDQEDIDLVEAYSYDGNGKY